MLGVDTSQGGIDQCLHLQSESMLLRSMPLRTMCSVDHGDVPVLYGSKVLAGVSLAGHGNLEIKVRFFGGVVVEHQPRDVLDVVQEHASLQLFMHDVGELLYLMSIGRVLDDISVRDLLLHA